MLDDAHRQSLDQSLTANRPAEPMPRRVLLKSSLTVGFAAFITPVMAQVITTPSDGLVAGEVKVPSRGVDLPAYRAYPASGGPFPVVLVIQEVFGVHEHIKDLCRRLAKQGYYAIATEVSAREGDLSKLTDIKDILAVVQKIPDEQVAADLDATVAFAKASGKGDTTRVAVTGFCWGGRQTWLYAAHNPSLKAAAVWYGPIAGTPNPLQPKTVTDIVSSVTVPVLGQYAGDDQGISAAAVEKLAADMKAAGKPFEIIVVPKVPHGFNADYRPSYRKAEAEESWARMLAFFKKNGM